MPTNKRKNRARVEAVIDAYRQTGADTDPLGMYTGIPNEAKMLIDPADPAGKTWKKPSEAEKRAIKPVQDADDL